MPISLNIGSIGFAILGGLTLGIATSINYIFRGRPTGMSGIASGIVSPSSKTDFSEKITIFGGMLFASSLFYKIFGSNSYGGFQPFGSLDKITLGTSLIGFAIAGLLVGFGTKLSNGCTSGHGLCGLPRFSKRSFTAVSIFFTTGVIVSTLIRQFKIDFLIDSANIPQTKVDYSTLCVGTMVIGLSLSIVGFFISKKSNRISTSSLVKEQFIEFAVGAIFASGLMISGMSKRSNILDFLHITSDNWNPALLFVFASGLLVNLFTFPKMIQRKKSLNGNQVFNPQNTAIDWKLIIGAFCFGAGWGIAGICPGPFFVLLATPTIPISVLWGSTFVIGLLLAGKISQLSTRTSIKKNK